jgi:Flp pilus assembly protein TadD
MLIVMRQPSILFLALSVFVAAAPAYADIDCAQCRAICLEPRRYPDELNPDSGVAVRHRTPEARAAFEEGRTNDPGLGGKDARLAVDAYKRAVKLDPENSQYRNHLAAALLTTGQADEAVYNLEQALRLVPSEPKYFVNLGYALHRKGDEQRALVWYMRAMALDPKDTRARLFAGYALEFLGLQQEAVMEFRRVLAQDPGNKAADTALRRLNVPAVARP